MASRSTITQAVYDEVVAAMSARSDVSDADAHVVLDESDLPDSPPAVSFTVSEVPRNNGTEQVQVEEFITNASGHVVDIRYREDRTFTENLTCLAKTDSTAVSVYEDLRQHFNAFSRPLDATDLHADVEDVRTRDSSPTSEDGREGHILRVEVDYHDTYLYSDITGEQITPATSVEQTIEAIGEDGVNETRSSTTQ